MTGKQHLPGKRQSTSRRSQNTVDPPGPSPQPSVIPAASLPNSGGSDVDFPPPPARNQRRARCPAARGRASRAAVRRVPDAPLVLDDASGLNATPISRQASFNSAKDGLLADLRAMLADAASADRPVVLGGARHSMGGQSLPRNGIAASFASRSSNPTPAAGLTASAPGRVGVMSSVCSTRSAFPRPSRNPIMISASRHAQRQCAWLAGTVWTVRHERSARFPRDACRRVDGGLLSISKTLNCFGWRSEAMACSKS